MAHTKDREPVMQTGPVVNRVYPILRIRSPENRIRTCISERKCCDMSGNECCRGIIFEEKESERSSPRPISTRKLNASPRLHIEPINLVVYKGSYLFKTMGYLILGTALRLDAFSVYPIRT